jgi:hypothetical protein
VEERSGEVVEERRGEVVEERSGEVVEERVRRRLGWSGWERGGCVVWCGGVFGWVVFGCVWCGCGCCVCASPLPLPLHTLSPLHPSLPSSLSSPPPLSHQPPPPPSTHHPSHPPHIPSPPTHHPPPHPSLTPLTPTLTHRSRKASCQCSHRRRTISGRF